MPFLTRLLTLALFTLFVTASLLSAEKQHADTAPVALKVLSYNINGLPAPLKKGKRPHYVRIAAMLAERRREGTHPHVVVIQEAFAGKSSIVAERAGYPYVLLGPGRKARSKPGDAHWRQYTRKAYASFADPQKFLGSGLVVLSDYPILEARHKAFDSDECAGFDCLANKAILLARVQVPGVNSPVDIVTSHFNSRRAAGGPGRTVLKAHYRQTETLKWFLDTVNKGNPTILAGDFNTKHELRYSYFKDTIGFVDAGESCLQALRGCRVARGTDPDELLYDTNDKQFYTGSKSISVEPRLLERNFDEEINGKPLSDHLGYEVHYLLTSG